MAASCLNFKWPYLKKYTLLLDGIWGTCTSKSAQVDDRHKMDESVTDKEEIKRRLEKMKLQYAKMQRKLTKSERRKSARNHVRRVLEEQANALSPSMSGDNSLSARSEATDKTKDVQDSSGSISRRSGRRGRALQKSISFKLDDSLEDVCKQSCDEQKSDSKEGSSIRSQEKNDGFHNAPSHLKSKQCRSIERSKQSRSIERKGKNGCENFEDCDEYLVSGKRTSYLPKENTENNDTSRSAADSNERLCRSSKGETEGNFKRVNSNEDCVAAEMTGCKVQEQRGSQTSRRCMDSCRKHCISSADGAPMKDCQGSEESELCLESVRRCSSLSDKVIGGISTRNAYTHKKHHISSEYGKETECSSVKVSRRSHRKKSQRLRKQDAAHEVVVSSLQRIEISSGETPSDIGETESSLNSDSQRESERIKRTEACDVSGSKETITAEKLDGCATLRWQGIFQATDPCHQAAWSGISSCEVGSSTALVMHRSDTVVLWWHTNDTWEPRNQWKTKENSVISDVTLSCSEGSDLLILITLTKDAKNQFSFITYNIESDTQQVEDTPLPEILEKSGELKTILSGHQGAVMTKTKRHICDIHFFDQKDHNFWRINNLKDVHATSFIKVEGTTDMYLCLSSSHLSLWSSKEKESLLEVDLNGSPTIQVDECLWSKAEGGLLFIITSNQQSSLALCVVNPATGVLLHMHSFMLPCAYQSLRLQDFSISQLLVAAVYSNSQTLIWDITSGRALAEIQSPDRDTSQVTATSDCIILNGRHPHLYQIT